MYLSEREMQSAFIDYLRGIGVGGLREIPLDGSFIDVMYIRDGLTNVVELKLSGSPSSILKALRQAMYKSNSADRVWICTNRKPKGYNEIIDRWHVSFGGIGVMWFRDDGLKVLRDAKQNDVPIERQIHLLQGFDYIAKNMKRGLGEIWYNGFRFYRDSL